MANSGFVNAHESTHGRNEKIVVGQGHARTIGGSKGVARHTSILIPISPLLEFSHPREIL